LFEGGATIAANSPEVRPREKLRKIEALFAGAAAPGEKAAAGVAADRSRARLGAAAGGEVPEEIRFSIPDTGCATGRGGTTLSPARPTRGFAEGEKRT
jgi:hypothetical protein